MRCYHFCTNDFVEELLSKKIIYADNNLRLKEDEPASYIKKYAFETMRLNNGNGMFFAWSNPFYKGNINFSKEGNYSLLELDLGDDKVEIKTNYENWCSFGTDIYEANGDLKEADKICREYGILNGLKGSYQAIFDTDDESDEIQVLLPYIKSEWIIDIKRCSNKHI